MMILAFLASGGCDKKQAAQAPASRAEPAAAAAPAAAPADQRLNLAVTVAKDTVKVGNALVSLEESALEISGFKEDHQDATFEAEEKLADGWAVRFKEDDEPSRLAIYRDLGGTKLICETFDAEKDQEELERIRSTCLGLRAPDEAHLVVPFAVPAEGEIHLASGTLVVKIALAQADAPATPEAMAEAAFRNLGISETGKLVKSEKLPEGFVVRFTGNAGEIATNSFMLRMRVGALDLTCQPWDRAPAAPALEGMLALCKGLHVPPAQLAAASR